MPKDEDILQLVSPALLFEVEDPWGLGVRVQPFSLGLLPVLAPLGGRKERVEGAAPTQHCPIKDARPIPGLGLVVASFRTAPCWERGRLQPWQAGFLPGYLEGGWPSGPCQTGVFLSALMRHLFSAPHPCLAQSKCVSCSRVHTHSIPHRAPLSCAPVHTTHLTPLSVQAEHPRHTATQHNPAAPLHLAHHTPQYVIYAVHPTHCTRLVPHTQTLSAACRHSLPRKPRPPTSRRTTNIKTAQHSSASPFPAEQHLYSVSQHTHSDSSPLPCERSLTSQTLAVATVCLPTDIAACLSLMQV